MACESTGSSFFCLSERSLLVLALSLAEHHVSCIRDSVARRLLATRVSRLSRSEAGGEALLQKTRLAASEFRKILMQHDVTATKLSR